MFQKQESKKGARISRSFFILLLALLIIFANFNKFERRPDKSFRIAWPAELIEHLVLGYKLPMADFFWIRFIQDMGYKDLNIAGKKTHLGWGYRMVDAITNLDHRYRIVYIAAGTVLSVEIEDVEGARRILEKGAHYLPTDWSLLYRLGYHYLYEVKDCKNAAKYLNEAGKNGAPPWLISLAARLYTAAAQYEVAYSVIVESLKRFEGTPVEKTLLDRKAELEKALNGLKVNSPHPATTLCR